MDLSHKIEKIRKGLFSVTYSYTLVHTYDDVVPYWRTLRNRETEATSSFHHGTSLHNYNENELFQDRHKKIHVQFSLPSVCEEDPPSITTEQGPSSITEQGPSSLTEKVPALSPCGSALDGEVVENDFREDFGGLDLVDVVNNDGEVDDWLARKRGNSVNDGDNYQQKEVNPDDDLEVVNTRLRGNRRHDSLPL